jgi:hypothetical protein
MKALRLPTGASADAYCVRPRRPRDPPVICVRHPVDDAPEGVEAPPGPGVGCRSPAVPAHFTWTPMGSPRSPGDPSCVFAPLLDPGRTGVPLPWRSHRCCPRVGKNEGFDDTNFGAHSRSFNTCSPTLRVSCCHSRARLASGWLAGLYREGVEPSGPHRKVSDHAHPPFLSS